MRVTPKPPFRTLGQSAAAAVIWGDERSAPFRRQSGVSNGARGAMTTGSRTPASARPRTTRGPTPASRASSGAGRGGPPASTASTRRRAAVSLTSGSFPEASARR